MRYLYYSNIFMFATISVVHQFGFKPWFLIPWTGVCVLGILAVHREEKMDKCIRELENKIKQIECQIET